jgi:hypothetical protein
MIKKVVKYRIQKKRDIFPRNIILINGSHE